MAKEGELADRAGRMDKFLDRICDERGRSTDARIGGPAAIVKHNSQVMSKLDLGPIYIQ